MSLKDLVCHGIDGVFGFMCAWKKRREILGSSRHCSPIWSKKQVGSAGTVVQVVVGGLLRLSCRLIRLNPGVWWGREKCLVQHPGSVLGCGRGIKLTVKFVIQQWLVARWLWLWRAPTADVLVRFPGGTKCLLPCCHEINV